MNNLNSTKLLTLTRRPVDVLDKKKLKSLSKKYSTIPEKYLPYFPQAPAAGDDDENEEELDVAEPIPRKRRRDDTILIAEAEAGGENSTVDSSTVERSVNKSKLKAPGAKHPGRPPRAVAPVIGVTPSVLTFFGPKK